MLLLSASSLFAQFTAPPDVPATAPNPEFPLHVRIFGNRWNHVRGSYHGFGRGDLLGNKPTGFDYTYSCSEPFLHNALKGEFYQARWKKQDLKLEILMQKVGSDHLHRCELNVALKPTPYGSYGASGRAPGAPVSVPAALPASDNSKPR
jgi:hypothetical protein